MRNRAHVLIGRRRGNSIAQPCDTIKREAGAVLFASAAQSCPELSAAHRSEVEVAGQYPHNRRRLTVEPDCTTKDSLVPAKSILPCRITQNRRLRRARPIFSREEVAAQRGRDPERAKESVANCSRRNLLGTLRFVQRVAIGPIHIERLEDMIALLPSPVVEIREVKTVAHRIVLEQGHQSRRFAIGQRLYQRRVYKRINCRCGSNSQREHRNRCQCESGRPAQPPQAIAQILKKVS